MMRTHASIAEHRFTIAASSILFVLVLVGFARTYYFKSMFGSADLPPLVHLHAALISFWFLLFIVQASLVERGRVGLHRSLGVLGAWLAATIVLVGEAVAIRGAVREIREHGPLQSLFPMILGVDSTILFLFAAFFAAALLLRKKRSDYHKRLMLLASLSMMLPAINRIPVPLLQNDQTGYITFAFTDLCVVALVGLDTLRLRRFHPAFAVGAPVLIGSLHVAYEVFKQPAWSHFATRMLS